jgi:transposase
MSYSKCHETSNLRTQTLKGRTREAGKWAALQRRFHPAPIRQMLLASSRGVEVPQIARNLGCAQQTVRDAIHALNGRGPDALEAGSSRPKRIHAAFDEESAEAPRKLLYRSRREVGYDSSLWTLEMAAEVAFEEGLTQRRSQGRPSGQRLRGCSEFDGCGPSGGSPLLTPSTKEKTRAAKPA